MAKHTTRDKLWNYALKATHRRGEAIDAEELAKRADTSTTSARDTLITMADMEIIEIDKNGREVRYLPADGFDSV